jgi:hypothetical protein
MAIQETDSMTAQQILKDARATYEAARHAVLERVPEIEK